MHCSQGRISDRRHGQSRSCCQRCRKRKRRGQVLYRQSLCLLPWPFCRSCHIRRQSCFQVCQRPLHYGKCRRQPCRWSWYLCVGLGNKKLRTSDEVRRKQNKYKLPINYSHIDMRCIPLLEETKRKFPNSLMARAPNSILYNLIARRSFRS